MELKLVNEGRRAGYAASRLGEFAERCRKGGLAVTPQRLAIIKALLTSAEHPRADTVYEIVRREHPHISLATVHRTLETLCEIGEARKVTTLHDSARYDGNLAPHHHVVCVKCRRVRDIEIPELEQVLRRPRRASVISRCSAARSKSRRCVRECAKDRPRRPKAAASHKSA